MAKATPDVRKVPSSEYKVFNDPVHGKIRLHPLLVHIIDTPQFQRLRNIKQLGGVYFVYPGASHNRFEHCIGTCHLAGLLVRHLQKQLEEERQPEEVAVDERDVLCVEIAALCHDLGHGPFSHAFDNNFIKKVVKDTNWTHEVMSIQLFTHMLTHEDNNKLKDAWEKYGMTENNKEFILKLINPSDKYWLEHEFDGKKAFLYEIVSNKITGIDVDKFDYFARDALHLGLRSNFDHMRYIYSARVLRDKEGNTRICCRETDLESLYDLFHTRHLLHRRAYQHKNAKIIEEMIIEAFVAAENTEFFSYPSKNSRDSDEMVDKKIRLSQTIYNPEAYTYVTDHVFHQILCSTDEKLRTAQDILKRVIRRDMYPCIGVAYVVKGEEKTELELNELKEQLKERLASACSIDDIIVTSINMNYGKKNNDPLGRLTFYRKAKKNELVEVKDDPLQAVSEMIKPKVFMEHRIVAYCKDKSKKVDCQNAFVEWCKDKKFPHLIDV